MDGDELGSKVVVGTREDDGDVDGDVEGDDVGDVEGDSVNEEPHDDAQKGPCWDSCGVS